MYAFRSILLLALLALSSCEVLLFERDPSGDPRAVFEALWKELDEGYSFFTFKQIDWNGVYQDFEPKVKDDMASLDLFELCSDMLYTLRDGHVNLICNFNFSRNWEWYLGYPANFDGDLLEREYWNNEQWYTGPFIHTLLTPRIGYVRYASFSSSFAESQLDFIIHRFMDTDGLILDLRDNGGGSTDNINRLASRFADQKRLAFTYVVKTGPGHDDFSEPAESYIEPDGPQQYTKPVVVLSNRTCYSAANSFVATMKAFPHVTVIGDWTGGGGGIPSSIELPNGWIVRYSATQTFLPDGFNIEGGIPPDIKIDMTEVDRLNGKDTILERALEALGG